MGISQKLYLSICAFLLPDIFMININIFMNIIRENLKKGFLRIDIIPSLLGNEFKCVCFKRTESPALMALKKME